MTFMTRPPHRHRVTCLIAGILTGLLVCAPAVRAGQVPDVTFTRDVAPLVFDRCVVCHHEGGTAPFGLTSYPEVRQHAQQIAAVTKSRFMPPWKAEPGDGVGFVGQHPLTAAEIATIQRWVDQGAVEGDRRDLPSLPQWTAGWQLGQPDLIVTLPKAYSLPAEGTDVFRIFVIPLPVDVARYVRGVEFRPGNARVVHHANMRIDRTPTSRQLDEQDPAPGYDGLMARTAVYPDGHFLGWTPGQVAPLLPKNLAWRLDRGTDLVVQLHMQPSGKPESVQPTIGLYFGGEPPVRTPAMLRLGSQGIDIPPGEKHYTISDYLRTARRRGSARRPTARALSRAGDRGSGHASRRNPEAVDLHQGLGFQMAARLSVCHASRPAQGDHCQHAVHLRQFRGEPDAIRNCLPARSAGGSARPTRWATSGCRC